MLALIASGRTAVFRSLRRPRHGDAALVRHVDDNGLCRPPCPGALQDRRRLAVASDLRPTGLPAPPPRLDAIELLTLLAEQSARIGILPGTCKTGTAASASRAGSDDRMSIGPARSAANKKTRQRFKIAQPDAPIQPFRRRRGRRNRRRFSHGCRRPYGGRPVAGSPHQ